MLSDTYSCTFCKILRGELPGSIIHEDDLVIVIVDLFPVNEGHLLVIPKIHAAEMSEVDSDTLAHIMRLAQKLNLALRRSSLACDGVNLLLADGEAAMQEIFHFHLHLIPRYYNDGFGFRYDRQRHFREMNRARMDEIAEELKSKLVIT